ncbi:MAG: acyl-CoA dehydrogenase [Frankiales bacterium]|nr:MAG: acyl-CoA dehydrogenase [Frankiales bacterium]
MSDEARELRDGVRDVLAGACTPATVRAAWPGGDAAQVDRLWGALGELGLLGLLVPEAAGGLDLGPLVAVAALEEAGYAGVPGPLVETVTVVAPTLAAHELLPDVLAGRIRVAVQTGSDAVPYAAAADAVLQVDGGVRLLVRDDAKLEPVATVDASRALATVVGEGSPLQVDADLLPARLGTAAFLLGLARRQVDLTVAYVKDRKQFGVAVGTFQALKHPLADAVVDTEFAWPAVLRAAQSLADGDPDAALHVAMAKLLASESAYRVSRVCLQAHGAIGYTTEYDLHLFGKRTWALAADWGSPAQLRSELATLLDLNPRSAT